MVGPRLRELLQRADGVGECVGPDVVTGAAEHPVCGDRVVMSVRRREGLVLQVRWRAEGCPATLAIAELATRVLVDVPAADVEPRLRGAIAAHGGLAGHERHAEAMVLRALAATEGR